MDDKTKHIQAKSGKKKYKYAKRNDDTLEYLMKFLELESYEKLEDFLERCHNSAKYSKGYG
jgi:hypothetical protein